MDLNTPPQAKYNIKSKSAQYKVKCSISVYYCYINYFEIIIPAALMCMLQFTAVDI